MTITTDLLLFGPSGLLLSPDSWGPAGARGADKVAQRFSYALLTPQGSVPGRPDDGSPFAEMARGFRSEFDVFAAFEASREAAANTVRAAELAGEPNSEKFGSVVLSSVIISDGTVTLSLVVTAADGTVPSTAVEVTVDA